MITHDRPFFTEKALRALLESCDEQMRVWVWHNGSDESTLRIVSEYRSHPHFHRFTHSRHNAGLRTPTNWFWRSADGQYISKVDDDCLVPNGWGQALRRAHERDQRLGILACWLFYDEDLRIDAVRSKLRPLREDLKIMQHAFVQGSGYVMKRRVYDQLGALRRRESFTTYCIRAAYNGWINGWHYPFLQMDHMDDPRSPNYPYQTDSDLQSHCSLTNTAFHVGTIEQARNLNRHIAKCVQETIIDPAQFFGWRGLRRRAIEKAKLLAGRRS